MNYIGEKIKELRRKHNMTQEKLAEYLCVSYQAISKWENGVSCPDVYMIAPLARLFGISTDELLGVSNGDARRAEFDRAYEHYWQKDIPEMYRLAGEAVAEFPGDMKYLEWLASMEYYVAFDEDYVTGRSDVFFKETLEKSYRHYKTVIESAGDGEVRDGAVSGICFTLKELGRIEEAKTFAALLPEDPPKTRDDALYYCLSGEELRAVQQRVLCKSLDKALLTLTDMHFYADAADPRVPAILDAEEAIIRAICPDGNYLAFGYHLYQLYIKRAECAMAAGEHDRAVEYLRESRDCARRYDSLCNTGVHRYTCPPLDGHEYKYTEGPDCNLAHDSEDAWHWKVGTAVFDPLREREDFKALLA